MIDALGPHGDGLATLDGRSVFVPGAAPGDRVRVRPEVARGPAVEARLLELLEPGAGRAEPPCPHFGPCGGCTHQHLTEPVYRAWKRDRLVTALARQGLDTEVVADLVPGMPGARRRAVFGARRGGDRVFLGFNEAGSHRIVDLAACTVLDPAIVALLAPLRTLLADLLVDGEPADIAVTRLEDGLDVCLELDRPLPLAGLERASAFAESQDLARLSWRRPPGKGGGPPEPPTPIAWRRAGRLTVAGVPVSPPPGGFIQATETAEAALADVVVDTVGRALGPGGGRVADLFCGIGAFALRLAALDRVRVAAVDGQAEALDALGAAVDAAGIPDRVVRARRDLARDPLSHGELAGFDAVVFDPPRAGAKEQAGEIAASPVPVVVAVSCNPASFARDARLLVDGGYRLESALPVDQFLWSPHLEVAAVFRRA
ncbi:MAG: class I SAM-dependent RNA methyltransferase [Azospirillaceae bacterium]